MELEKPEQADGADTEFSELISTLAGRSVKAEAEGDLNLYEASLAWGNILSIEAGEGGYPSQAS